MNIRNSTQLADIAEHKTSFARKVFIFLLIILIIAGGVFFVVEYQSGKFRDLDSFQDFVNSYGYFGPVILCVFQCFKVIYAFIPGTLGYIVGPTLFGSLIGIICNYIGICLGSFIAFMLSRKFGESIMRQVFSERRYNRYTAWIKKKSKTKSFSVLLWLLLLIPFSPDDFLCYFAGLSDLSFKRFCLIIFTVKPWLIIFYGVLFGAMFN